MNPPNKTPMSDEHKALWRVGAPRVTRSVRELLGLIDADGRQALRHELIEAHEQYVVPASIAISRPYLIVVGTRSST